MSVRPPHRRYHTEMAVAMLAYALVLVVSLLGLRVLAPDSPWRWLVSLAPMLPSLLVLRVVLRQARRMDELQLRVQFEAIGFAFAGTALLTFGYGFLENVGLPRLPMFTIWPLMAVLWIVGGLIAARRYR